LGKKSLERMTGKSKEERVKESLEVVKLTESLEEPSQDLLNKLVELKIAEVKDSKFVYSQDFIKSFDNLLKFPPSFLEQARMANKINDELIPLVIAHGEKVFKKGKRAYENIVEAYAGFERHCKLNSLSVDKNDVPNIIYGVYYLNDHEPLVQQ